MSPARCRERPRGREELLLPSTIQQVLLVALFVMPGVIYQTFRRHLSWSDSRALDSATARLQVSDQMIQFRLTPPEAVRCIQWSSRSLTTWKPAS